MADEIMTAEELAAYLKLDPQTVYRRFRNHEIPGAKIGSAVRFKKDVIDRWLRVKSAEWTDEDARELRAWGRHFAKENGITEQDVVDAIREIRAEEQ
jgi:excisionase family DNA binding protein